jgi:DNA-binding ferritin-like protein
VFEPAVPVPRVAVADLWRAAVGGHRGAGAPMVKQGSFFQRLKERWGSSAGIRVDGTASERKAADVAAQRGMPVAREVANGGPAEARSSRKMSDREEAMLALGTHFQELTALLRGSQARTDEQLQRLVDATSSLGNLPALSQQQLESLRTLSAHMERQNALGEQLASTMTKLPTLLENVESARQRAAATDQRTAETVREFQSTMDRIHQSMGQMVQHSEQQSKTAQQLAERRDQELKGLADGISRSQESTVAQLRKATDDGLSTLRRAHEDQSNRLQRVVQESAGWNRAVLVGIGLVLLGIGALVVLQIFR